MQVLLNRQINLLLFKSLHRRLIIARSITFTSHTHSPETSIAQGDHPSLTNAQPAPDKTPSTTPSRLSTHSDWELHLSVTPNYGNRTFPTSSSQWRALRTQILLRDKLTCSSCGYLSPYPQGRSMIVDHKDGDASNNDPSNLRVHCPPCYGIRHCGLADSRNWLILGESSMKQDEIVRKTREMFENTGVIPDPKDIDPSLKTAHVSVLDLANMMKRIPWKDLPEKFQRLRGFFTEYSSRLFEDTMLVSGKQVAKEPIDDSTEALLNKHDQTAAEITAWKGLNAEEPYDDSTEALLNKEDRKAAEIAASKSLGLPWIRYSEELHKSSQVFLDLWLPSETLETQVAWICVDRPRSAEFEDELESPDVHGLLDVWEQICDQIHSQGPPTTSKIDELAKKFNVLCGKWLVFASSNEVDNIWGRIVKATLAGTLGHCAKVSPRSVKTQHVICVYNSDYTSVTEVNRVRDELRLLGVNKRIRYKPDVYTHCGIYKDNIWGIPASRYSS